jgi:hypothetical protein
VARDSAPSPSGIAAPADPEMLGSGSTTGSE